MVTSQSPLSCLCPRLHRCARALLVIAVLGSAMGLAGTRNVLPATPAYAQASACTQAPDGSISCPTAPANSTSPTSSSGVSSCYSGASGWICTDYGGGAPVVSNCIQGQSGYSCTILTPGGSSSIENCLISGNATSCSISTPGYAPQSANCLTSGSYETCANYYGGALSSASTCQSDSASGYSCTSSPQAGSSLQGFYESSGGQYCTDASGGQIWVPAGASTDGLTCGSLAGS